ncbi:iron ABC transporter permease [Fluviicola sp.]|jgi:iron complex transport system permease protein|uniref:FecCD family ABC transporter permease n=1 Tax=Fluviicola sp. TaxID=1917219 RepID=UPI002816B3D8|nr:iron ABC transporter permease [Fluviicola sp.]MDR0802175.1 iron ABC transporter permease [Fluviicola sp.]
MWKKHLISFALLLVVTVVTIGYPHGTDDWFSFLGSNDQNTWNLLVIYRIPEVFIAIISGFSLSVSGLLLQTTLNNPLADPSILGLTSGSHLMVALTIMGSSILGLEVLDLGITISATIGVLIFGLLILVIATRVRSMVSLLLVGMMLGTFVSAITNIILMKADANSVKGFSIWGMGSLQQVSIEQIPFITLLFAIGIVSAFLLTKPLNTLVLGEKSAEILGVRVRRARWSVLLVVSLLAGLVTAFCGPIGFVGLVVPNLVRMFYKTANHGHLLLASGLTGASVMVLCALMIRIFEPVVVLPINSLTALLGAPVVLFLLLKNIRNA